MRCYSCSVFPGSQQIPCPGPSHLVDSGVACTVRALSDGTVVYQGNAPKETGCSQEMVQHYNFLTDKMFRLGNSRSACCDWDLCNLTWETANMTESEYQDSQQEKIFQENSTLACRVHLTFSAVCSLMATISTSFSLNEQLRLGWWL